MKKSLIFLIFGFVTMLNAQVDKVDTYVVVSGIAKYKDINSLRYTKDDAYKFWGYLQSTNGGSISSNNIILLLDEEATKINIQIALRKIALKADANDRIIFYFSGHGSKGAFIPYDYNGYSNLLYHSTVSKIMKSSKAKHKIIIADACFSGSLNKGKGVADLLADFYVNINNAKDSYVLLMSSSSEETSIENNRIRQGVFSYYLIKGLKGYANTNNDKEVSIDELYKYISNNVKKYTANHQNPVIYGDYDKNLPMSVITDNLNSTVFSENVFLTSTMSTASTNKVKLSIAVNDISEHTEVFIDGDFVDYIRYLYPKEHPGCEEKNTVSKMVSAGKHIVKLKAGDKIISNKEVVIEKNISCFNLYYVFNFDTQTIQGLDAINVESLSEVLANASVKFENIKLKESVDGKGANVLFDLYTYNLKNKAIDIKVPFYVNGKYNTTLIKQTKPKFVNNKSSFSMYIPFSKLTFTSNKNAIKFFIVVNYKKNRIGNTEWITNFSYSLNGENLDFASTQSTVLPISTNSTIPFAEESTELVTYIAKRGNVKFKNFLLINSTSQGFDLSFDIETAYLKNKNLSISAYYYVNGKYKTFSTKNIKPSYVNSNFEGIKFFVPFSKLGLEHKKNKIKFFVSVYYKNKLVDQSSWVKYTFQY